MKKLLLWLWQLPQNIIGTVYSWFTYKLSDPFTYNDHQQAYIYLNPSGGGSVTLGQYIFMGQYHWNYTRDKVLHHEYGHVIQSQYLGWLYLPVIGLSSLGWVFYRRIQHYFNIPRKDYYSFWTESWANKLGGVKNK